MPDYKAMYLDLFNKVTDAIDILQKAQQAGELKYVDTTEPEIGSNEAIEEGRE